jgi:quercetin dioxygenase-like cupin family protein
MRLATIEKHIVSRQEVKMSVIKYSDVTLDVVDMKGVRETTKSDVIGIPEGWETHTLRVFRIAPGGFTPHHTHDWEHVNFVIKGKGTLTIGDDAHNLSENDFALVPPNTMHQFKNPYDKDFEFICIVPIRGAY